MGISLDEVVGVLRIIETVLVLVLGVYVFITRNSTAGRKETDAKIDAHRAEVKRELDATGRSLSDQRLETDKRIKSVCDDLKTTNKRVDVHGERISTIEEGVRCAPSHDDLGKLHGRIDDVAGAMREIKGTMKGMAHTLGLIHNHLLDKAKENGR